MINRRDFVKSATGAGALFGMAGVAPAADTGMIVALNVTFLLGNKIPWPEFARLAARTGFGGTDVLLAPAMEYGADPTRNLLRELKLRTSFAGFPVSVTGTDEVFQKGMATLEESAKFLSDIGCSRMHMALSSSTQMPVDDFRKMVRGRLSAVNVVLARHNVRLGMENLAPLQFRKRAPNEFIWRFSDIVAFSKECGSNIGVTLDSWHWYHAGGTVDDIVKAKSQIVNVHVSDAAKQAPEDVNDNQRLLPGEGVIDLMGFFHALKQIDYQGFVSPETRGRIPLDTPPEQAAKMTLDSTLAVMRKAGVA